MGGWGGDTERQRAAAADEQRFARRVADEVVALEAQRDAALAEVDEVNAQIDRLMLMLTVMEKRDQAASAEIDEWKLSAARALASEQQLVSRIRVLREGLEELAAGWTGRVMRQAESLIVADDVAVARDARSV